MLRTLQREDSISSPSSTEPSSSDVSQSLSESQESLGSAIAKTLFDVTGNIVEISTSKRKRPSTERGDEATPTKLRKIDSTGGEMITSQSNYAVLERRSDRRTAIAITSREDSVGVGAEGVEMAYRYCNICEAYQCVCKKRKDSDS